MAKVIAFNKNRVRTKNNSDNANPAARYPRPESSSGRLDLSEEKADVLVSVVVPTCGRPHLLSHCLAALLFQRFSPARYEIIVVDDRPSRSTRDIVSDWASHAARNGPAIIYIANNGPHGPAAARNRGWRAARGEIIAFTDDDTVARADWLQNGMQAFDQDVQAVWGKIVMPLASTPTDYERDAKRLEEAEFVTANCFVRRKVLEEIDGFDERFQFAWREDADLYFRLLSSNKRVLHVPSAVITHPIRPAPWGVSLSQQKKVQSDALLYKKHPQLYREKIRKSPRWDYYLIVASLLVSLYALLAGQATLALGAGGIWLAMTARFCRMRLKSTSRAPSHIAEMLLTSALIPPLAVFWRLVGMIRFRVGFL